MPCPACIVSKDVTVKFAQTLGTVSGSSVLQAPRGQGGYNERFLHKRSSARGKVMTPVRYMPDIPVMVDGVVKLVPWPWLPPSELVRAIMQRDPTKVLPPPDYWQQMLLDFPGHPAGLLGRDVQACGETLQTKQLHH